MHACIHTCLHIHTRTHIYTYTYLHTCTHTLTHTHTGYPFRSPKLVHSLPCLQLYAQRAFIFLNITTFFFFSVKAANIPDIIIYLFRGSIKTHISYFVMCGGMEGRWFWLSESDNHIMPAEQHNVIVLSLSCPPLVYRSLKPYSITCSLSLSLCLCA
jgi:hypothetical protein